MKLATTRIAVSSTLLPQHPDKQSTAAIVHYINATHGSTISWSTVIMMVWQGRVGESRKSRGPGKNIPSQVWKLMKGVFVPLLKLEQASGATQLTMKQLALRTIKCMNKGGFKKSDLHYVQTL